jgi:4-aminobutyrate aminotransferase-like enzyme
VRSHPRGQQIHDQHTRSARREHSGPGCRTRPEHLTKALKAGGVLPFVNFNRVHVVPPLNIADEDLLAGLAVLDEALEVTDASSSGM